MVKNNSGNQMRVRRRPRQIFYVAGKPMWNSLMPLPLQRRTFRNNQPAMPSPTEIRKGRVLDYQGAPHLVLEMMHRTQGRQAGFVQTTLRNLNSGSTTTTKFRSTDNVSFLHTETNKLEFSYVDAEGYHFMDPESYEDTVLPADLMEDSKDFLVENTAYDILFVDGRAIELQLPVTIEMEVTDAPEGLKGDSVSNVQKSVTLETGLVVHAPLFIKTGERIRINTDTKEYQGRA
tara:strand:- start:114 stop:812 length:699 start_codon:yes stop_codon:yes gene_type:complete